MPSTPPDTGQPTWEARTDREDRGQRGNKWWTLVAVCLGTFMLLLDITIVNVALPDIQRALQSSFADLQWVVDAYALTLAAFLLTAGSLADMYGRRRLYLAALVVFLGPVLGGVLTSGLSWRWIFFVTAPIGVAAVIISVMRVAESRAPQASRPDWAGFALFTVALASLVYGLIESSQRSFTDGLVLGCFAAAAVLLAVFVIVERRSAHPMFDLSLFRLPAFSGGFVAAFGLSSSIFP